MYEEGPNVPGRTPASTLPQIRLNDIQFRLELLERTVNRIADELEQFSGLLAQHNADAKRQREAWDGR